MKTVVITGSESGIGLGMVKYLLKTGKADNVFAIYLRKTEELTKIAEENKNVHIIHLDLKRFEEFGDLALKIGKIVGDHGLNLLMNNAGFITASAKLEELKAEQFIDNFAVNTVAPILLTKALLPLLRQAAKVNREKPMSVDRAAVINTSSLVASIALNSQGAFYPYRCSKTAINAATKSMSIDLKEDNILVASMNPGWVQTNIGGKSALIDVETSVAGIFNTIENLREKDTGKYLQYDGVELPW